MIFDLAKCLLKTLHDENRTFQNFASGILKQVYRFSLGSKIFKTLVSIAIHGGYVPLKFGPIKTNPIVKGLNILLLIINAILNN